MKHYLKERWREIGGFAAVWLFLNLYLGLVCAQRLYGPDLIYMNVLMVVSAAAAGAWDYTRWKKLARCLENGMELTDGEEAELLGDTVRDYLCREREELQREWADSARKLEELSDYITCWTHEAKLPLASLRLMNERNQDETLRNSMQECIGRLELLIHTMMIGSKLQRPENDVRCERISLEEAVRQSVKNQSYDLIHHKFQISMELGGLKVYSDKRWLVYLLDQLVGNAVKYRSSEPALAFRARGLEDGSTELAVEDNGIGISGEELPFIFQRGYVGKNLRRGDCRSTGMGLYFARKIGDLIGVSIRVESREGEGSRFYLHFQDNSEHLLLEQGDRV